MSADCATCGKTAACISHLRSTGNWECSHIDCPNRGIGWSEQQPTPRPPPQFPQLAEERSSYQGCHRARRDVEELFDSVSS